MTNIQFQRGAVDAAACVGDGWALVKPNYWLYFGMSLLAMLLVACIPCLNVFLLGPVLGGVYYVMFRTMRGEPVEFGMMFKGFEKFVPLMVVGLVQSIPGIIYQVISSGMDIARLAGTGFSSSGGDMFQDSGTGLAVAGGLVIVYLFLAVVTVIWTILLQFSVPLIIDRGLGAGEALKLSASASFANFGGLFLLFILIMLMAIAGVIALCVGVLFVIPIMYAANAVAFRRIFPDAGGLPVRYDAPPPPDAYAGGFGRGL